MFFIDKSLFAPCLNLENDGQFFFGLRLPKVDFCTSFCLMKVSFQLVDWVISVVFSGQNS